MKTILTVLLALAFPAITFAQKQTASSSPSSTECIDTIMRYSENTSYKYGDRERIISINRSGYVTVRLRNGSVRVVDSAGSCITPSKSETTNYDQTLKAALESYRNLNPKGYDALLPVCRREEGKAKWLKEALRGKEINRPALKSHSVQ